MEKKKSENKTKKTKKIQKTDDWFADFYANSASGSVIKDYESGNVKTVYIK